MSNEDGPGVAPLRGNDPMLVRLRRHATGITVLVVAALAVGLLGLLPMTVPWWLPATALLIASVLIAAVYARYPRARRRDTHLRAAVQTGSLTGVIYATGWGFALPFVHLFGISDNINESGSDASGISLGWAVVWTFVAQLGVAVGIVPLASITPAGSHLVAGMTTLLLVLVTGRLRSAAAGREHAQVDVLRSEQRFRTLVEDATDVTLLLDRSLVVTYVSPSVDRVLGHAERAVVGHPFLDLVAETDRSRVRAVMTRTVAATADPALVAFTLVAPDGSTRVVEANHRELFDDPVIEGLVVSVRDVSERAQLEEAIEHGRLHDEQTGLLNRRAFAGHVDEVFSDLDPARTGLLAVELDGVEQVAEAAGGQVVDDLVASVATALATVHEGRATVGRIGQTRFALLVADTDGFAGLHTIAERLRDLTTRTVEVAGISIRVRARIGIVAGSAGVDGVDLFAAAELALRAAVESGSDIGVFGPALRDELLARLAAERDLRRAIDSGGELFLEYQPLVSLGPEQSMLGVEALVRWQHPDRGRLQPGLFIPMAEANGQVVDLGWWVLDAAVEQLAHWDVLLGEGAVGYVGVNVSMLQFAGGDLPTRVERALHRHGVAPRRLHLELTETALAADPSHTMPQLSVLAATGVQLAIDDFGTGYSSMAYLQQFPVDVLKVDRTFVSQSSDAHRPELLSTMRQLGSALGLQTLAEGIETEAELAVVRELGFDVGQGYLFGRPVPPDDIAASVRARRVRTG